MDFILNYCFQFMRLHRALAALLSVPVIPEWFKRRAMGPGYLVVNVTPPLSSVALGASRFHWSVPRFPGLRNEALQSESWKALSAYLPARFTNPTNPLSACCA